jgi:hypothetical protein
MAAEAGVFSYAGQAVTFVLAPSLVADTVTFSYTGQAARAILNMEEFPEGSGGGGTDRPKVVAFFYRPA